MRRHDDRQGQKHADSTQSTEAAFQLCYKRVHSFRRLVLVVDLGR